MALSAGACVAAALAPGLIVASADRMPLLERLGNALVSYAVYLRQMVFPAGLATPYPNAPHGQPAWKVMVAMAIAGAITAGVLAWRKKRPWLLAGWLWYVGMLVPVIGIIQISNDAAHADRYTYLPGIGLAVAGTWAVGDWASKRKFSGAISGVLAVIIGGLMVGGNIQVSYWKDNKTLWARALACTSGNSLAHNNMGLVYAKEGKVDEAMGEFRKALEIKPDSEELYYMNLGVCYFTKGDLEEAIAQYRRGLAINPASVGIHNNLGAALLAKGSLEEAAAQYRILLQVQPDDADTHYNLGNVFLRGGKMDEAIAQYRKALETAPEKVEALSNLGNAWAMKGADDAAIAQYEKALAIQPGYTDARCNLANALARRGKAKEAIAQYWKVLEARPDEVEVQSDLAWLLATSPDAALRDGAKALGLAARANQLSGGGNAIIVRTLAAAYAEGGSYGKAAETARGALELAVAQKNETLAGLLREEIKLYEAGAPARASVK